MLVKFDDGVKSYYLAPQKIKVGDKFLMVQILKSKVGNALAFKRYTRWV